MATTEKLEADAATVHELFQTEANFRSPIFQRRYVWGRAEIERLWSDIDSVLDGVDSSRFLGAVVLQDRSSRLAFAPRDFWVIDGQQRLTTLFLLLGAIAEVASRSGQGELAKEIANGYLLNQRGDHKNRPKIRPTNRDLNQFGLCLQRLEFVTAIPPEAFGDEKGSISDAYRRLLEEVQERKERLGSDYLKTLASTVLEKLKFVQITLSQDEDPHQVFDSLNNAGQKLLIVDLVRNHVFQKYAEDPQKAEALYNGKWRLFEDSLGKSVSDYFFPFALTKKPSATKSLLFFVLREHWKDKTPDQIVDDLLEFVPAFKALTHGESLEVGTNLMVQVDRLSRMPVPSVVYPFAMQVIHAALTGSLAEDLATKSLLLVESFLVRRAFAGFEPTGLHAVFKDLWSKTKGDPTRFVSAIEASSTIQYPDDMAFVGLVKSANLYNRRLAPYVITEYERSLSGGDPAPDVEFTLDHVMPQERKGEWAKAFAAATHQQLLHTWANLVPLSQPANAEKSTKSWKEAQKFFQTETIFKTTKRLARDFDEWTPTAIGERAKALAEWAVVRWPKGT